VTAADGFCNTDQHRNIYNHEECITDIQVTDLQAPRYQLHTARSIRALTITVFPLVYMILLLFALSFVDTPRAVAGVAAYIEAFLKDIVIGNYRQTSNRWKFSTHVIDDRGYFTLWKLDQYTPLIGYQQSLQKSQHVRNLKNRKWHI
jgi:hypothetical protein